MKYFNLLSILCVSLLSCDNNEPISHNQMSIENVEIIQNVLPPGFYIKACFTSSNNGYTISNNGGIYKTEDGGYTWIQLDLYSGFSPRAIFFLDDSYGAIIGVNELNKSIILLTYDGGQTWETKSFEANLSVIFLLDKQLGYALGDKLYKTTDSGQTWTEIYLGFNNYCGINFFDKSTGLITADNSILKTIDGGTNWNTIKTIATGRILKSIHVFDNVAMIVTNGSDYYKSTDRGQKWASIVTPTMNSVHIINKDQIIGVGQFWYRLGFYPCGVFYLTNDGGFSWEEKLLTEISENFYSLNDIAYVNDSTVFAVGQTKTGSIARIKLKMNN